VKKKACEIPKQVITPWPEGVWFTDHPDTVRIVNDDRIQSTLQLPVKRTLQVGEFGNRHVSG